MKIVHCVTSPSGGGAGVLVRELNRLLPLHGAESSALFLANPRGIQLSESEFCIGLRNARRARAAWEIRRFLDRHADKRTIVHAHLTYPFYLVALPGVARRRPKVYTEHSTHNRRRDYPSLRPIERHVYNRYQRISCISEGVRSELLRWVGGEQLGLRAVTVRNGARLFSMAPEKQYRPGQGLRLISVGSLSHKKGLDRSLEAVSRLGIPVEEYVIIGDGEERESLQRLAVSLGLGRIVRFVGWQDEIEAWLHSADLQIIPSRWEGFGLVAVEGLSTGLPIVATDVPGLKEVLGNLSSARLVVPDDSDALAAGIAALVKQMEEGVVPLAHTARERAEQFSLGIMAHNYVDLYREVLEDG